MFQLLYQHLLKGTEIFDILQFVHCNSIIAVRTIKRTQVYEVTVLQHTNSYTQKTLSNCFVQFCFP
jgi:hypothetical protein